MTKLLTRHTEAVKSFDDEECCYLPLLGIYHPQKDQIRVVFDSSAKSYVISLIF